MELNSKIKRLEREIKILKQTVLSLSKDYDSLLKDKKCWKCNSDLIHLEKLFIKDYCPKCRRAR